jgi:hypothetical protein
MLMSVSQYAEHSGMSRRSFYNWESKQGFPARVDGKIDQEPATLIWPVTVTAMIRALRTRKAKRWYPVAALLLVALW